MKKILLVLVIFTHQQIFSQNQKYLIKPANINDSSSNFGLSFCSDGFVVFSTPTKEKIDKKRKKNVQKESLDFHIGYADEQGNIHNVRELGKGINSFSDEIDIAFSPNHKTVYFTKSTSADGSKNHLELYKADVVTIGYCKNIIKLPFNDDSYSVTNPFVSADGKELYFSSNMPNSKGGFDIYKVAIFGNNEFGEPINLGNDINTKGDEVTPFVTSKKIYFSSNGHQGMGKLDVFVANLNNLSTIRNLGTPINSSGNDYYFKEKSNSNIGYFTSDRASGSGKDDIYFFKDVNKIIKIEEEEFAKPKIKEVIKKDTKKTIVKKKKDPKFELRKQKLLAAKDVVVSKEIISDNTKENTENLLANNDKNNTLLPILTTVKSQKSTTVELVKREETKVTDVIKSEEIKDDFEKCQTLFDNLNNIYFDLDKYNLTSQAKNELGRVIQIMQRCPKIIVLASSHTDSRAGYEYNMELSRKRANAVMNYILRNGKFSEDRIRSIGFGEARLLNKCTDGVKCAERQHQINRRTEFEIANY